MSRGRTKSIARRALAPLLNRLDARAAAQARREIDRYHLEHVEPLARQVEAARADISTVPRHSVYLPALPTDEITSTSPFMAASTCAASDFLHPRFGEIAALWHNRPHFHRKLWEHVFIVHHLLERGVLQEGARGIGFGVGGEALAAVFASFGCRITATDAPAETAARAGWSASGQFAPGVDALRNPGIVDPVAFRQLVSFRPVDMNHIDDDLVGFDFAWSSCCFEHLGSLRHGMDFVLDSTERCLKPGGVAVHTTEFNLTSNEDTVETPDLSFYRRRDLDELVSELTARGHRVAPIVVAPHSVYLDDFVDTPPFREDLHLKIAHSGFTITSAGLVIERGPT